MWTRAKTVASELWSGACTQLVVKTHTKKETGRSLGLFEMHAIPKAL